MATPRKKKPASLNSRGKKPPGLRKFQIRGLGWAGEVTVHKLSSSQVLQVKAHADRVGESTENMGGSLEEIVEDYNCYDTNLWQSGVLPFLHASRYALVDDSNKVIHSIDNLETLASTARHKKSLPRGPKVEIDDSLSHTAAAGSGNVLIYTEEHKGVTAVWELESECPPDEKDLTFRLSKLRVGEDETLYVAAVLYQGKELERNYDEEMLVGKASYSQLL